MVVGAGDEDGVGVPAVGVEVEEAGEAAHTFAAPAGRERRRDDAGAVVGAGQERLDAEATLKDVEAKEDIDELEKGFVETAKSYSQRKGISYAAWRQVGVPASVLKAAGIPRSRKG